MIPELCTELEDTFALLAEGSASFPAERLPFALKALGIEADDNARDRAKSSVEITLDEFFVIVAPYLSEPGWIQGEMMEAMSLFDQDSNGYIDANEITQVFIKLGEKITKSNVQDQIDTWSRNDGILGGKFSFVICSQSTYFTQWVSFSKWFWIGKSLTLPTIIHNTLSYHKNLELSPLQTRLLC